MLDFEDDMANVFFGSDFAGRFLRHRAGAESKIIVGIFGVADEEALEGRVIAAARVLRGPAVSDVRADDVLEAVDPIPSLDVLAGARFKVIDQPKRVNDGAEKEALLGSVSA
ncbi:hypothetical protein [Acidovorax sp. SUPP2825]|uniref:hypothetical protein n=1 Tax=Acidovorax sp. SUPP2825 TaxID=2920879 RepID=UPI0023DE5783|nr:hypothetical protein [Acidovorax sp. SUPP2825]GKS96947.1 hypothetical protein AVAK2825_20450 [Acidovorax sp. SUPP2825]